jgi:toxin-antitoxin system PIN domain toxin
MIVPDVNLLIYAHDRDSRFHAKAKAWWEKTLSEGNPVGIPWVVVLAFTRLATHPQLNENPMTVEQVREIVESWLAVPTVQILSPGRSAFRRFFELLLQTGAGGNLATDALIAAHALDMGAQVCSNDSDFSRFNGLKWFNPIR